MRPPWSIEVYAVYLKCQGTHFHQELSLKRTFGYHNLKLCIGRISEVEPRKVLAMTLFNRPQYARRVLEALRDNAGIEEWLLILLVEPDNREVVDLAKHVQFTECIPIVNPIRYGAHRNTYEAMKRGFEFSDFVVYCQEDDELAPDALRFFEHCRSKFYDDKEVFSVNAWRLTKRDDCPVPEINHYRLWKRKHFNSFTLATWKDRWEEPGGMRDNWGLGHSGMPGWDIQVDSIRGDRYEVFPLLPRARNIGEEGGLYTPSKEWHQRWVGIDCWAGDPVIRDQLKENADRWLLENP